MGNMADRDFLQENNQMDDDLFGMEDIEDYNFLEEVSNEETSMDEDKAIQNEEHLAKGDKSSFFPITVYLPDDYDQKTDSVMLYVSKLAPGKKVTSIANLDYLAQIKGVGYWNFSFEKGSASADIYYGVKNKKGEIKLVGVEQICVDTKLVFKLSPYAKYNKWKKENLENVKTVKSLHVESGNQHVSDEKTNLKNRLLLRENEINRELEKVNDFLKQSPGTQWAIDKKEALQKDLKKSLDEIKQLPDSKYVNEDKREQIIKTLNSISSMEKEVDGYNEKWHKFDQQFVGSPELMNVLEEIKISPAELKALIGQESGDLTVDDSEGDIAGIGQIGAKETVSVGYKAEERLDPNKAIIIAAKVLKSKMKAANLNYKDFTDLKDYKSFVFATYNKGQTTVKNAMDIAYSMGLNKYKWHDLIKDDLNSPMYKSILSLWPESAENKFEEVKTYVKNIFDRLK